MDLGHATCQTLMQPRYCFKRVMPVVFVENCYQFFNLQLFKVIQENFTALPN